MFQVDDDGTLTAYSGDETEIVIPSSVKTIAQAALSRNLITTSSLSSRRSTFSALTPRRSITVIQTVSSPRTPPF